MKWILFNFFVATSLFNFAQLSNKTLNVEGTNRSYLEYLPANYQPNSSIPILFVLHGLGGNNTQMTYLGFNQIADTAQFIAIYPQGLNNGFGQAAWNNGTGVSSTAKDVLYISKLIDLYETQYNIDPTRVYVTGFSMGSIMSHRLALALNNRVAAIGGMAGPLSTTDMQNYNPNYKTPVIHLHGTDDATVPYDSNPLPSLTLVPETMNFWRNVHGCQSTADSTRIADTANDNITIDRFVYHNCSQEGALELWRFNGADHIYLYEPQNDITESIEVWRFLSKWQHPNPSLAGLGEKHKSSIRLPYPNPVKQEVNITLNQAENISLLTVDGKKLKEWEGVQGLNTLSLDYPMGLYYLVISSGKFMLRVE